MEPCDNWAPSSEARGYEPELAVGVSQDDCSRDDQPVITEHLSLMLIQRNLSDLFKQIILTNI